MSKYFGAHSYIVTQCTEAASGRVEPGSSSTHPPVMQFGEVLIVILVATDCSFNFLDHFLKSL